MGSFTLKLKLAQRELNYDHAFIVLPAAIVWWGNSVEPCAVCHCLDNVQQIQLYCNESFVMKFTGLWAIHQFLHPSDMSTW